VRPSAPRCPPEPRGPGQPCGRSATITFDRKGCILSWSEVAERLFGYSAVAALDLKVENLLPRLRQARRTSAAMTGTASAWRCAQYPAESPESTVGRHRDGHLFPLDTTFATLNASASSEAGSSEEAMLLVSVNGGVDSVVNLKSTRLLIGRSDQTGVDDFFVTGAQRAHASGFQDLQQLGLGLGGKLADFVEE